MKKRNTKSLKLHKKLISNLRTNDSYKLNGGRVLPTEICGLSEEVSCYSPCGGPYGTTECYG